MNKVIEEAARQRFETAMAGVINGHSQENQSNTPDFILGDFVSACLTAFNAGVNRRADWYGRHDSIGAEKSLSMAQVRELLGFLSAELPELHSVEVPRLNDALTRYLGLMKPAAQTS